MITKLIANFNIKMDFYGGITFKIDVFIHAFTQTTFKFHFSGMRLFKKSS